MGGGVMKCSGEAVLVADLVTQLPELVNLANERGGGLRNLTSFHFLERSSCFHGC